MDFLHAQDPALSFRKRTMRLSCSNGSHVTVPAFEEEPELPPVDIQSKTIELCSMSTFTREIRSAATDWDYDNAIIGCLTPDDPLLSGEGAIHPAILPLLREFSDVLTSEIPGGLPPERTGVDGLPLEHTIEISPDAKPYARPPRPFTQAEEQQIRRYIDAFFEQGWLVPSLSPWAAPILFVPKKADPTTGERTWRMVVSYVKLSSKTLNRIASRLPRIADLLARVSRSAYFSKLDLLDGFYQIRMRESDIEKTAIATPFGNYHFRVMPMGLCGAPGTFQRVMDDTFHAPAHLDANAPAVPFSNFLAIHLDDL